MTDDRTPPEDLPIGAVDASGEAIDVGEIVSPGQAPMDDAAGGPDIDVDDVSTDDLSVQGGA